MHLNLYWEHLKLYWEDHKLYWEHLKLQEEHRVLLWRQSTDLQAADAIDLNPDASVC